MLLKASEAYFFFFIISSSSLISQAHHPSDLSHQPSSLIKLSSPLNTKAKAVAVASPSPRRRRCQSQPPMSPSLAPAPAPGVARHSHLSASPLPAHPRPCRHRPIFPSNPSSNLAVTAAPPPCSPRRPSPLQVSALFSFLVNFFNCCFGLIFLGLVLILC